jgi:hypothetical protein
MRINNYAVLPAAIRYNNKLSPSAKLLYAELSACSGPDGRAEIDIAHLSATLVCDRRSVYRYLSNLIEEGGIQRDSTTKNTVILPLGFETFKDNSKDSNINEEDKQFFDEFLSRFEKGLNTFLEKKELYYHTLQERLGTFSKNELMKALENRISFVNSSPWHQDPDNRMNAVDINLIIKDTATVHRCLNMKSEKQPVELKPFNFT